MAGDQEQIPEAALGAGLGSQATGSLGGGAQRRAGAGGWVGRRGFCWGTFHSGALDCGDLTACEGNPGKLMSRTEQGQSRVSVTRLCAYKQSFGGDDITQGREKERGSGIGMAVYVVLR